MPITKEKKQEIVKDLQDQVTKAASVVFVNFHGLSVADATMVRKALRSEAVGFKVAKKTLMKRAFAASKLAGEFPELAGEIAVAYGDDPLIPAKKVYEFEKKLKDQLKIVGGVYDGHYVDAAYIVAIASIPSREVLYGKFVNLINSPIQRFVMVLDQIAKQKSA